MPVSTKLDTKSQIIVHEITGELSLEDVLDGINKVYTDRLFDSELPVLWDMRQGTAMNHNFNSMKEIVDAADKFFYKMNPGRTAVLVGSAGDFGMARMFQELTPDLPRELMIFESESEALSWLLETPQKDKISNN